MNESTNHSTDDPDPGIHEATQALQDLAAEVEQERAERGRSALDPLASPSGQEAGEPETREDHAPNAQSLGGLSEEGVGGVLPVGNRMQTPH